MALFLATKQLHYNFTKNKYKPIYFLLNFSKTLLCCLPEVAQLDWRMSLHCFYHE